MDGQARRAENILKGVLWVLSAFYMITGLLTITSKQASVAIANVFFLFNLQLTPQVEWLLNPFARYWIIFGLILAIAATNPSRYRLIIYALIANFAIRIFQRIVFLIWAPVELVSQVDPWRAWMMIGFLVFLSVAIIFLERRIERKH